MKNYLQIVLIVLLIGCKSTQQTKNNQLDVTSVKNEKKENTFQLSQVDLNSKEIVLLTADPKKPTTITDANGHQQKFQNVKSITIKSVKNKKKDSLVSNKIESSENSIDKSKIKETASSISDTVQYKGIFIAIASSIFLSL
ncbi:hypothetical protein BST83_13345 [Polaribacter filamentus]|uniref:Uncharacterized protein n=1 Tax=Polaribacter filamentus TaxID=53483 RepID=A0A2S7KZK5_9FLAO|nr:hypothetical protein [Polaribacter filamentus]PQB08026.1 hypothetical protein BST83_13345 [Polaribacter filamentus]